MITAGCDVGSLTAKAVILDEKRVVGRAVAKSLANPGESARMVMGKALEGTGLSMDAIDGIVGTGYGREQIDFVHAVQSEIACHARGARHLVPSARTVIDIGGQDCKAIRLEPGGAVARFITNDKCAAGTGRFLEVMAQVLDLPLDQLGRLGRRGRKPVNLASTCTVWAQADVIRFINDRFPVEDIAAGICTAMAQRMAVLANSLGLVKDLCMTGGVAKNQGVVKALEEQLGLRIRPIRKMDPQLAGALGAALLARETKRSGVR
jgi:predicted CoA-substrate-specific enzyme activase